MGFFRKFLCFAGIGAAVYFIYADMPVFKALARTAKSSLDLAFVTEQQPLGAMCSNWGVHLRGLLVFSDKMIGSWDNFVVFIGGKQRWADNIRQFFSRIISFVLELIFYYIIKSTIVLLAILLCRQTFGGFCRGFAEENGRCGNAVKQHGMMIRQNAVPKKFFETYFSRKRS